MKENLSYKHTEDGEVHPGEVIEEKISLSRALRPVGQLLSVQPGRVPGDRRPVAAQLRRRRRRDRGGARRGAGLGARARLALGPRRLPVRQGLRRASARDGDDESTAATAVDVAVGVLIDAERALPARPAPGRQGLRRLLGIPGRQARGGRVGSTALRRELHEELGHRRSTSADEWCGVEHVYEHAHVRLHFCTAATGTASRKAWKGRLLRGRARLPSRPLLPATIPLLAWLDQVRYPTYPSTARRPTDGDSAGIRVDRSLNLYKDFCENHRLG